MSVHTFYNVSKKTKVQAKVIDKRTIERDGKVVSRILVGQAEDGTKMTAMVNKKTFDEAVIEG